MPNYLIDMMTWSHSRLNTYLQCPYQFYLKYICSADTAPMFFAEYGSLVHRLLARHYRLQQKLRCATGEVKSGILNDYLVNFSTATFGACPSFEIKGSFFSSGLECMKHPPVIDGRIVGVEEKVNFEIEGRPFVGFVDLVYEDENGAMCILDHKSRSLKPRSTRKKPTRTDAELDEYLRQLYLYSIPITAKYGRFPDFLVFDCYRTGTFIKERFCQDALEETKRWALSTIQTISEEKKWKPNMDLWRCKYLCPFWNQCEYAQMVDFKASKYDTKR